MLCLLDIWTAHCLFFLQVTGALKSEVSIYYLNSLPLHPFRTTTSLLIESSFTLSMYNVTSKLHFLLKHIPEVSSVTVQGEETTFFFRAALLSLWSYLRLFFPAEKWHSCKVLQMIHEPENTLFRKKWLSRTIVSVSHHFCVSDSHLWDVSCKSGK